jgi:hypothetical protein
MVEHGFSDEVLFELGGEDMPGVFDCTRDGEHVFWLRAYDDGKAGSFVWDGVAGPQFDDLVLVDKSPLVFSPDKHHVAWIGKRGETFVVVVDNAIRGELSNVDMEAIPAVSNSGRIALVATVGTRRVIIDGSPFTKEGSSFAPPPLRQRSQAVHREGELRDSVQSENLANPLAVEHDQRTPVTVHRIPLAPLPSNGWIAVEENRRLFISEWT